MEQNCLICERVASAKDGTNPNLIHEFQNSCFVIGDHQYFKGYSLILLKEHFRELHELPSRLQQKLFKELMAAGQAVFNTFRPWKMNYSCYGNQDQHVHWHIIPRYESDPDHHRHPWLNAPEFKNHQILKDERTEFIQAIRKNLKT